MNTTWKHPTRDLDALTPMMRVRKREMDRILGAQGLEMIQLDTYRDPWTQARLFRRSRLRQHIEERIEWLETQGFPEFGAILSGVGPQYGTLGKHVTWAASGQTYHHYGMASDQVPRFDSKRLLWDIDLEGDGPDAVLAREMWAVVGAAAEQAGLEWGGTWKTPDRMHVQIPQEHRGPLLALDPGAIAAHAKSKGWWTV